MFIYFVPIWRTDLTLGLNLASAHHISLSPGLSMDSSELWVRVISSWIYVITTAAAAAATTAGRDYFFPRVCWCCAIVFNVGGELRLFPSVDLNQQSCTHTLEHSLMSVAPLETSHDLNWVEHSVPGPLRSLCLFHLSKVDRCVKYMSCCTLVLCSCLLVWRGVNHMT